VSDLTPDLIASYRNLSGSSVANAIETFDVRLRNEGFADGRIRCLHPQLPPIVGYAATATVRTSSPPPVGHRYHDRTDWWNYIASVPAPRIVVVQDVDVHAGLGAFSGDLHAAILRALGCVGYVTDGSVRDVDDGARTGFQMFASGVSISHAFAHLVEFGAPVNVGGLPVSSGDLLFGDANGLLSIPPSLVTQIPLAVQQMETQEARVIAFCESPQFSIDGLRALVEELR
jgi:4-hydroxy-4-methyl-2-oxoglutarate aldolase